MNKKHIFVLMSILLFMPMVAIASDGAPGVQIDLTAIITAIIGLMATIISGYLIPFIKAKIGVAKYEQLTMVVSTLVEAAEQIYGDGGGKDKLKWVQNQLEIRGFAYDRAEVEAAVYQLGQMFTATLEDTIEVTDDLNAV